MSAIGLGSRAIIGEFFATLAAMPPGWVDLIAFRVASDQESETYKWLGQIPALREWIGGRQAKGFKENGLTIRNKEFEATLEVLTSDLRRDKTGQLMIRVQELARRAATHPASLISTLILNGGTTVCYDGQYFFDTDHTEGNNTSNQDNTLSVDISAVAAAAHGSTTAPSIGEAREVITQAIAKILGFKDNENEPVNEDATDFLIMTPPSLWPAYRGAVGLPSIDSGDSNLVLAMQNMDGFNIRVAANARLSSWTDKVAVFRTDAKVKPFILQTEVDTKISAVAEGSELEFNENKHRYGVYASRNAGYGLWQHAVLATMT